MSDPDAGIFLDAETFAHLCRVAALAKKVDCTVLRPKHPGDVWRVRRFGSVDYENHDLNAIEDWLRG